jgi:hypothetical protein
MSLFREDILLKQCRKQKVAQQALAVCARQHIAFVGHFFLALGIVLHNTHQTFLGNALRGGLSLYFATPWKVGALSGRQHIARRLWVSGRLCQTTYCFHWTLFPGIGCCVA